jgi:hypothetical protein
MSLDPTGEVRPSFQKTAPERTQRTIFELQWRLPSPREATLRQQGFPCVVIEGTHELNPAPNDPRITIPARGSSQRRTTQA